jgi:RNA 2',3'-cyclic 3'-phosphodiesterase
VEEQWRCFVALDLSRELRASVTELQHRLRSRLSTDAVKFVRSDQLHLTLKFLGNVRSSDAGALTAALENVCASAPKMNLLLDSVGCFPDFNRPSVIWVGIHGEVEKLTALAASIGDATAAFGDHDEKRAFRPHLTIARVKNFKEGRRIGESLKNIKAAPLGEWTAARVELIRSQLSPKGATYTTLAGIPLT